MLSTVFRVTPVSSCSQKGAWLHAQLRSEQVPELDCGAHYLEYRPAGWQGSGEGYFPWGTAGSVEWRWEKETESQITTTR